MPKNLKALIRYRAIDECLRQKGKYWTLDQLRDACEKLIAESESTIEYIGSYKPGKRTLAEDLKVMRSGDLGFEAPIVYDRAYRGYTYEDKNFSIQNSGLNAAEMEKLKEGILTIRQIADMEGLEDFFQAIKTIEKKAHITNDENQFVFLHGNEQYSGKPWIQKVLRGIRERELLNLTYRPFGWDSPQKFEFEPYLLKEYNNRWFVYGLNRKEAKVYNYALDRIEDLSSLNESFLPYETMHSLERKLSQIIGVTIPDPFKLSRVVFSIKKPRSNYVSTKPLHASQIKIEEDEKWVRFSLVVAVNRELEALLHSFGKDLRIEEPKDLRSTLMEHAREFLEQNDSWINK